MLLNSNFVLFSHAEHQHITFHGSPSNAKIMAIQVQLGRCAREDVDLFSYLSGLNWGVGKGESAGAEDDSTLPRCTVNAGRGAARSAECQ